MLKPGKRTKAWESTRRKLKVAFECAGIVECELKWPGCWRDNSLGFAHHKKRRNLKPEELTIVILACSAECHRKLELLPEKEMEQIVLTTIANRETQPKL